MTREEALQAIKAKMDYYESDKRLRGALETLIPELAESEDERIREELVAFFKEMRDTWHEIYWHDLQVEGILAWLKKQKEQKPADLPAGFYVTFPDGKKYYTKEMRCNGMNVKVVEPKQVKWSEEDEDAINGAIGILLDDNNPDFVFPEHSKLSVGEIVKRLKSLPERFNLQPKQEWSEEDEKMRQSIIKDIEFERNYTSATTNKTSEIEKYNEQINWLKSLSLNLKKRNEDVAKLCSNEWSEEDIHAIENCKYAIKETFKDEQNPHRIGTLDWLKSLRPQSHWKPSAQELGALKTAVSVLTEERTFPKAAEQIQKIIDVFDGKELRKDWKPSEEQMEALERASTNEYLSAEQYDILVSLYEQLKQL